MNLFRTLRQYDLALSKIDKEPKDSDNYQYKRFLSRAYAFLKDIFAKTKSDTLVKLFGTFVDAFALTKSAWGYLKTLAPKYETVVEETQP